MTKQKDVHSALHRISDIDALLALFPPALRSHSRRVAVCSAFMADYAQDFDFPAKLPIIAHLSGIFHDVGKLLLPPSVTSGPEYQKHPAIGAAFLYQHKDVLFDSDMQAQMVCETVWFHHARPDGKGFPYGSPYIPLTAGICAIANALDNRLYINREADMEAIRQELKNQKGRWFWESVVYCFERAWPQLKELYTGWAQEVSTA